MTIQLKLVTLETLITAYNIQKESFKQLFDCYQDTETSPYLESFELFSEKVQRKNNYFYLIMNNQSPVGFIRVVLTESPVPTARVAPICILPTEENQGFGKYAMSLIEAEFPQIKNWQLSTILQETRLLSFYRKLGYHTGNSEPIIPGMDRIFMFKEI
jgi:predicted acetyltransferase